MMPAEPRIPAPIAGPGAAEGRVSGALKPAGGQAITPGVPGRALNRSEIVHGPAAPVIPGHAGLARAVENGERVGLNFVSADLVEVADVILAQLLGLNYVIDPAVSGQVTMRTTEPIPRSALLGVLESILAMNGAALVLDGNLASIVPGGAAAGLYGVAGPVGGGQSRGRALYVIPIKHASAESISSVARSVLNPGSEIIVAPERNYLMFSGTSREARAVQDLVNVLDVSRLAGRSFGLFPLEVASAEEVADELATIFDAEGEDGPVRFLPITRMSAVLVISEDRSYLEEAQAWVSRLDRASTATGTAAQVYVYHVRNGRAGELAAMLGAVFGGEAPPRREELPGVAPTLEPVSLRNASTAPTAAPETGSAAGAEVPAAGAAAPARTVRSDESVFAGAAETDIGGGGPPVRFIADERNNAIVILATPNQYELAHATLQRLDIVPLQVLIEVTIAEVSLDNGLRYGLQWFFESGDFSATLSNFATGFASQAFPGFNAVFDSGDARAVLSALAEVTDVKVVSSPQLMVLDNQVARLHVGDQVPIATQSAVSVIDPESPIVNSIQLVDTGVILEVTPRVNASGLVTLEVVQDVSDAVATITSGIDSPTIQQRTIQTTVAVQSGATVALGGLIRDRAEDGESGVPLLKDVPVLGSLFKTTERSSRRTELLVLITPHVLRDTQEAVLVTRELKERLGGLRAL
ncbi:MAG TPA: type II secretion system secretin GspD, partial [Thermohalobaculum sp.]|nr:type II secretion system secretin GspD [Thermohalobaculum sp.]